PTVHRLHEPDGRDLDQVVERLGGAAIAQSERAGERHVALDERFARPPVPDLRAAHEALILALAASALARGLRRRWRAALWDDDLLHVDLPVPPAPGHLDALPAALFVS